jgi:hypothetical protein
VLGKRYLETRIAPQRLFVVVVVDLNRQVDFIRLSILVIEFTLKQNLKILLIKSFEMLKEKIKGKNNTFGVKFSCSPICRRRRILLL